MIRVASRGFTGPSTKTDDFLWVDGLLHQKLAEPTGAEVYVPVMEWLGPVQTIDERGWPTGVLQLPRPRDDEG